MAKRKTEVAEVSESWPAYRVERKPIDWLKPYPQNARTHSPEQVEQLRGSLRAYGWTIPVLAREDGTIVAGHGRVEAAKLEGITEVPVIVATGWSEEQCRSYALADNQIALNAAWDRQLLALEVQELDSLGVDLDALGFESVELSALLTDNSAGLTDPDEVPEPPVNPVSKTGDLWLLGAHVTCPKCKKNTPLEKAMLR